MNNSNIIITNIKELVGILPKNKLVLSGKEMNKLSVLKNAFIEVKEDKIESFGLMKDLKLKDSQNIFDANGGTVIPSWNDSHTHLVFAKSREEEFIDKINGLSYEQIAKKGGGILNSALHLEKISEEILFENSRQRLQNIINLGTGSIEIKSGYGLSLEGELKILRTIKRLKETFDS